MNAKPDYRASAAECCDVAEEANERDLHWLHLEQFWLGKDAKQAVESGQ